MCLRCGIVGFVRRERFAVGLAAGLACTGNRRLGSAVCRSSQRRREIPGDAKDVSRAEFENIETVLHSNADRLKRIELRLEAMSHEIAELIRIISTLRPRA